MPRRDRCRVGVLASGHGTNLQALIDASTGPEYPAVVAVVITNRPGCLAVERATRAGVPTRTITRREAGGALGQDQAIAACLREFSVDLVVTAGYDRILGPETLGAYALRIINIHPSLLPAFGQTLQAQRLALDYGVKITGCTTHFATDELDAGPIILQRAVPVLDDDTVETLSARILREENALLPETVRLFAEDRLRLVGRRVNVG